MANIKYSSLVPALPSFLTWKAGGEIIPHSCNIYIYCVYQQLRVWSKYSGVNLLDAVLRLPKPCQQRLLLAPELFYLLQSTLEPGAEEINAFQKYLQMEEYLWRGETEQPRTLWSALGDCFAPEQTPAMPETYADEKRAWRPDRSFKAQKTGHIVLDAYSPFAMDRYPTLVGELHQHSQEETEIAGQRVVESLKYIHSINPIPRSMIDASVQVVKLARQPANTRTSSMSFRSTIGMVTLFNASSEYWTVKKIANAMIHEAIHSLIYKLQLTTSLYTDEDAAAKLTIPSPWSGRTLYLHSFVHACFVWYGLWNFWSLISPEEEEATELREKARKGFLSGPLLSALSAECYRAIHPQTRNAIEEMSANASN